MKNVLLIVFLLLALTGSAFAMKTPQKMLLFWNNTDTTSYVYFGTDRVVFGTDPITI